jgi:hypothetical protein
MRDIPSGLDSFRQFLTPVYAIFNALDGESTGSEDINTRLIPAILEHNEVLRNDGRGRISKAVATMKVRLIEPLGPGMNLPS